MRDMIHDSLTNELQVGQVWMPSDEADPFYLVVVRVSHRKGTNDVEATVATDGRGTGHYTELQINSTAGEMMKAGPNGYIPVRVMDQKELRRFCSLSGEESVTDFKLRNQSSRRLEINRQEKEKKENKMNTKSEKSGNETKSDKTSKVVGLKVGQVYMSSKHPDRTVVIVEVRKRKDTKEEEGIVLRQSGTKAMTAFTAKEITESGYKLVRTLFDEELKALQEEKAEEVEKETKVIKKVKKEKGEISKTKLGHRAGSQAGLIDEALEAGVKSFDELVKKSGQSEARVLLHLRHLVAPKGHGLTKYADLLPAKKAKAEKKAKAKAEPKAEPKTEKKSEKQAKEEPKAEPKVEAKTDKKAKAKKG